VILIDKNKKELIHNRVSIARKQGEREIV